MNDLFLFIEILFLYKFSFKETNFHLYYKPNLQQIKINYYYFYIKFND